MYDPREEFTDLDELDLEKCLAGGLGVTLADDWPDFEAAFDDEEPQPEPGDFCEVERPEEEG